MAELSTLLGKTTCTGVELEAVINAETNPITVSDTITVTSDATFDNAMLDLSGAGSINSSGKFTLVNFSRIEGLASFTPSKFHIPATAAINGTIKDIGTVGGKTFYFGEQDVFSTAISDPADITLTIDNVDGYPIFWGACNGVTGQNLTLVTPPGLNNSCWSLFGDNITLQNSSINAQDNAIALKSGPLKSYKSKKNHLWRNVTIHAAREEAVGWDALATQSRAGVITAVDTETSTLTIPEIVGGEWYYGTETPIPLTVGQHLLLCSGVGQGRYYEITSIDGDTVGLNTSTFSLTDVAVDDICCVNMCFVEPEIDNVHIYLDADEYNGPGYGQHVGVSLWGSVLGAYVHDCTVESPAWREPTYYPDEEVPNLQGQSCGFNDAGMVLKRMEMPGTPTFFRLNSRNRYINNQSINCYEDLRLATWFYNGTLLYGGFYEGLGKIDTAPLMDGVTPIMSIGTECQGHIGGGGYVSIHNVLDAIFSGNTTNTPSTIYDDRYQSAMSEVIPGYGGALGGETSTTFAEPPIVISAATGLELSIELGQVVASVVALEVQADTAGLELSIELGQVTASVISAIQSGWYVRGQDGKLYGIKDSQGRIYALQQ